ncbi:MAG: Stk1 family PASTA domain-containing Ser/Thr kinase [Clostridia bacterium]|nr:Stk1 family PASTA domain-containing Ser/Thr kinase [Clostridia bacterium]
MNLEGKMLGNRYEMLEKIGNGGMATVYKAMDKILKRYVAVKILRDEYTTDQEFIRRFEAEAQSAARLTHPNIVSIYDVGVEGNLYYIVMELIQGKTLKEIIVEEQGPLPWKWSVNIAIQIASALEMAHRNNIIHRDIKPHNIIITEDGIAKVTDFGIAKAVSNSTITAFGTTIGSVHYFSPEHARGGYTDAKSDIYSLGVVMYEMVTGKVPFDADTPVSIALKHMQEEPEEPIKLNQNLPTAINKIILKALKKDATLRYQTSTEMLVDLKAALKNPSGDFVEELEYNPVAATQRINTEKLKDDKKGKKENKFKDFIKNHKIITAIITLVLLFGISLGATLGILSATKPKEVEIPKVVGLLKEQAKEKVENAKLVFEYEEEYNKDVEAGYVISQDPVYREIYNKVKEGTTVKVKVSKGKEKAIVPKVAGLKEDEALKAIEQAKLKAEVEEEENKKIEAGVVISQETDANTEVYAGDTLKIHVSKGAKQATVTSVIGKKEEDAKKELEGLGFKVTVITGEDNSKENGAVIKQSIDAGKKVDADSEITITVNQIAEMKEVKIIVNVKSLLKNDIYETVTTTQSTQVNPTGTVKTEKKVKDVHVKIDVGGDIIYSQKVNADKTDISAITKGTGTNQIKVYVDDVLKDQGQINYSSMTTYTAE